MAKDQVRDLRLKLRFRRILFCQGYWCPIEVELSQYTDSGPSLRRIHLTDLDVLGIKYDGFFSPVRVVGDCKSGRSVSEVSRLFWLKGVSSYFGADQAYFIHSTVKNHTRAIAPKLGLRVLDEQALLTLEQNLRVEELQLPITDLETQTAINGLWGIKAPAGQKPSEQQMKLKEVYSYLSYSYWYIEQHRNILSLVTHFEGIASLLDPGNPAHVLLAYTGLERFAHSLLDTANSVLAQGGTNIPRDAKNYIFGGPLAVKEKETFFELLRTLKKSTEKLEPRYFRDLTELLGRMIRNPHGASDMLRHISAMYLWCAYLGNDTLLTLGDAEENVAAIVLARDAADIFVKATGMKRDVYRAVFAL